MLRKPLIPLAIIAIAIVAIFSGTFPAEAQPQPLVEPRPTLPESVNPQANLDVSYVSGLEYGPYHLSLWWPTAPAANRYRIIVEHQNPGAVPSGTGTFTRDSFIVSGADTRDGRMHRTTIGGKGVAGFYPGGTFTVRVQGISLANNEGTPTKPATIKTYAATELGAVRRLTAAAYVYAPPTRVRLQWYAAPGQRPGSHLSDVRDSVQVRFRPASQPNGWQDMEMEWIGNVEYAPYRALSPQLEHETEYVFEVTPKRVNMPDGDPAEVRFTTPALQAPPAMTIEDVSYWRGAHKLGLTTPVSLHNIKVYAKHDDGTIESTIRGIDNASRYIVDFPDSPNFRRYCFTVVGIVGTGADALEGPPSNEVCIDAKSEPGRTTSTTTPWDPNTAPITRPPPGNQPQVPEHPNDQDNIHIFIGPTTADTTRMIANSANYHLATKVSGHTNLYEVPVNLPRAVGIRIYRQTGQGPITGVWEEKSGNTGPNLLKAGSIRSVGRINAYAVWSNGGTGGIGYQTKYIIIEAPPGSPATANSPSGSNPVQVPITRPPPGQRPQVPEHPNNSDNISIFIPPITAEAATMITNHGGYYGATKVSGRTHLYEVPVNLPRSVRLRIYRKTDAGPITGVWLEEPGKTGPNLLEQGRIRSMTGRTGQMTGHNGWSTGGSGIGHRTEYIVIHAPPRSTTASGNPAPGNTPPGNTPGNRPPANRPTGNAPPGKPLNPSNKPIQSNIANAHVNYYTKWGLPLPVGAAIPTGSHGTSGSGSGRYGGGGTTGGTGGTSGGSSGGSTPTCTPGVVNDPTTSLRGRWTGPNVSSVQEFSDAMRTHSEASQLIKKVRDGNATPGEAQEIADTLWMMSHEWRRHPHMNYEDHHDGGKLKKFWVLLRDWVTGAGLEPSEEARTAGVPWPVFNNIGEELFSPKQAAERYGGLKPGETTAQWRSRARLGWYSGWPSRELEGMLQEILTNPPKDTDPIVAAVVPKYGSYYIESDGTYITVNDAIAKYGRPQAGKWDEWRQTHNLTKLPNLPSWERPSTCTSPTPTATTSATTATAPQKSQTCNGRYPAPSSMANLVGKTTIDRSAFPGIDDYDPWYRYGRVRLWRIGADLTWYQRASGYTDLAEAGRKNADYSPEYPDTTVSDEWGFREWENWNLNRVALGLERVSIFKRKCDRTFLTEFQVYDMYGTPFNAKNLNDKFMDMEKWNQYVSWADYGINLLALPWSDALILNNKLKRMKKEGITINRQNLKTAVGNANLRTYAWEDLIWSATEVVTADTSPQLTRERAAGPWTHLGIDLSRQGHGKTRTKMKQAISQVSSSGKDMTMVNFVQQYVDNHYNPADVEPPMSEFGKLAYNQVWTRFKGVWPSNTETNPWAHLIQ